MSPPHLPSQPSEAHDHHCPSNCGEVTLWHSEDHCSPHVDPWYIAVAAAVIFATRRLAALSSIIVIFPTFRRKAPTLTVMCCKVHDRCMIQRTEKKVNAECPTSSAESPTPDCKKILCYRWLVFQIWRTITGESVNEITSYRASTLMIRHELKSFDFKMAHICLTLRPCKKKIGREIDYHHISVAQIVVLNKPHEWK